MTPTRIAARERVATVLRQAREGANLTQNHMAEQLDRGLRTIVGWEAGEGEPPATYLLQWLAICGRPVTDLDEIAAEHAQAPDDPNEWWTRSRCVAEGAQPMLPGFDGGVWIAAGPLLDADHELAWAS